MATEETAVQEIDGLCILIDTDTRIYELDSLNYAIQQRKIVQSGDNIGSEYWVTQSYHNTLDSIARKLVHSGIRGKNLTSLNEVVKVIDTNVQHMSKTLKKVAYGK